MPRYKRKPADITAIQLKSRVTVHRGDKNIVGDVGEWLVADEAGELFIYTDALFKQIHDVIPGPP